MKKIFLTAMILISMMTLSAPLVSAQTSPSAGCTTFEMSSGTADDSFAATFTTGEVIALSVTSADGGLFDVTIAGNLLLDDAPTGSSTNYSVLADGNVTINVTVTVGTGTYSISCTPVDMDDDEEQEFGVLCHYPPGNPAAAHTIRVGSENAVQTHISKHGDTLGACPAGVQTRTDIPSIGITIFVIYTTDSIQVYGNCTDTCLEVLNTPIILIIDLDLVVINIGSDDGDDQGEDNNTSGGNFIYVDNPEDFGFILGEVTTNGLYVVIYYLHPDPDNPSVGVFQINVYDNGSLLDDSILVFIGADGSIIQWTDQGYWEEQLQQSLENDS